MPNKKAAAKALRQDAKKARRNKTVKDTITYQRRHLRKALEAGKTKEAVKLSQDLIKQIDKAVQNKVLKQNTGSRMKSRLMANLNKAGQK